MYPNRSSSLQSSNEWTRENDFQKDTRYMCHWYLHQLGHLYQYTLVQIRRSVTISRVTGFRQDSITYQDVQRIKVRSTSCIPCGRELAEVALTDVVCSNILEHLNLKEQLENKSASTLQDNT